MKLSEKLKELRAEKGKTQKEVATVLGVSENTYRKWEYGRQPGYGSLCQLAAYYEVTIDYLLGKTGTRWETEKQMIARQKAEKIKAIKEKSFIIKNLCNQLDKLFEDLEILMKRGD